MPRFETPWECEPVPHLSVVRLQVASGGMLALHTGAVDVNVWLGPGALAALVREAQAAQAQLPDEWRNYSGDRDGSLRIWPWPEVRVPVVDVEDVPF